MTGLYRTPQIRFLLLPGLHGSVRGCSCRRHFGSRVLGDHRRNPSHHHHPVFGSLHQSKGVVSGPNRNHHDLLRSHGILHLQADPDVHPTKGEELHCSAQLPYDICGSHAIVGDCHHWHCDCMHDQLQQGAQTTYSEEEGAQCGRTE